MPHRHFMELNISETIKHPAPSGYDLSPLTAERESCVASIRCELSYEGGDCSLTFNNEGIRFFSEMGYLAQLRVRPQHSGMMGEVACPVGIADTPVQSGEMCIESEVGTQVQFAMDNIR
ncbi:hypothetical protein P5673_024098 [Acropora cervicornis]|uniref:Uncharacterized protein n=1 Tax=Acropora cervicornis TaxID=6130 RepID=A0AAD9Q4I4_ACRCE|nr:hypothetical protein P5673_024098 [Acropora cervicornis]